MWGMVQKSNQRADHRLNVRNEGWKEAKEGLKFEIWLVHKNDIVLQRERKDENSYCSVG